MAQPITRRTKESLLALTDEGETLAYRILGKTIAMREAARTRGMAIHESVLNALELTSLVRADVSCLLGGMIRADGAPRAVVYARHLILTVQESSLTFRSLLTQQFRDEFIAAVPTASDVDLRSIHRGFHELFERVNMEVGDIRDGIVGHLDRDADLRAALLRRLDVQLVAEFVIAEMELMDSLGMHFAKYTAVLRARVAGYDP